MKLIPRIVALSFLLGMFAACTSEEKTAKEMLEDETQREEIMTMISEDPEMTMEMHDHMKGDKHAMMKDSEMVMDSEKMEKKMNMIMDRMEEDSVACKEMAQLMMKNKHMKSVMLSSCKDAGMMMGKGMKSEDHMKMHR